jgi:2,3-bisphosphoglycerate-dependent phosphoglycerate mutase
MPAEQLERERLARLDVPFPEGESWREAVERHGWFLNDVSRRHDGACVLVIGHVATWWALDHFVGGHSLEELVATPLEWQEGWRHHLKGSPSRISPTS